MSRCDSAAIVPNTSELLPEPETPVNTVSRRLGISTLTSLRLFSRAPCTRIRSWLSAACSAADWVSVLGAVLILSPPVGVWECGSMGVWEYGGPNVPLPYPHTPILPHGAAFAAHLLSHPRPLPRHSYDGARKGSVTDERRRIPGGAV